MEPVTRPDRLTLLAFGTAVVLGGANAIAVRQTVQELAPFWSASVRFVAAGVILVVIALLLRRSAPRGRSLVGAAAYGAIGFAISFATIYTGLREVTAGTAAVLLALAPLLTFGFAIAHGQERFRMQGLVGAAVAFAGVAIVFADQLSADVDLASMVLILIGSASIAEGSVILKATPRSDPFWTNAVAMTVGAVVLFALTLAVQAPMVLPAQPVTWAALLYLVIPGSVLLFGLVVFTMGRWTASGVSYIGLLMPFVTVPLEVVLTGRPVSPLFAVGGAVALAGVYIGAFLHVGRRRVQVAAIPDCAPVAREGEPERAPA